MAVCRSLIFFMGITLGLVIYSSHALAIDPSSLNNPQFSQVATDPSGSIHSVWVTQSKERSELFYQAINPFSPSLNKPAFQVTQSNSRLRRPQVVFDGRGEVHLLWQERFAKAAGARTAQGTWVHYARFHPEGIYNGGSFRHVVLNNRPKALHPDLSVDVDGNALVVWEEGEESLVLAKIGSDGTIFKPVSVSANMAVAKRSFPAVTTDRSGNIHLTWTATSKGRTDRIAYAVLEKDGLRPLVSGRILHSVPSALGQRKSLSVEPTGQIRLAWSAKQARGRLGDAGGRRNHLILNPAAVSSQGGSVIDLIPGGVTRVVDRHLNSVPQKRLNVRDGALLNRLPVLSPPDYDSIKTAGLGQSIRADHIFIGVDKALQRRLLEFSSWTGAPPSGQESFPAYLTFWDSPFQTSDSRLSTTMPNVIDSVSGINASIISENNPNGMKI